MPSNLCNLALNFVVGYLVHNQGGLAVLVFASISQGKNKSPFLQKASNNQKF